MSGEAVRQLRRRWAFAVAAANVVGAGVVFVFLQTFHAVEGVRVSEGHSTTGTQLFVVYLSLGLLAGLVWRERRTRDMWRWLRADRAPTSQERDLALHEPIRELAANSTLWGVAALFFAVFNMSMSTASALEHALTIALGGVTTCALVYLWVDRLLRPVTTRALATEAPARPVGPGVRARLTSAWVLASGVPLLGLGLLAIKALGTGFEDADALAVLVLILTGAGIAAGSIAAMLAARSLADPLGAVRHAMARVHAGDLDVEVAVDDGSEVGLLEAGFNEMAAGLRERERLRDLFGRHVGEDVARRALAEGVVLGGEVRDIGALFVDVVGSTTLAANHPPEEVVRRLNRFFGIVVDVVEAHGGWVNKFEGDASLCVFGAPADQPDFAGEALAAARAMHQRLRDELPDLDAGIGVSAGPAVAGNVGSERRLEYTVVGDPVNEAARLCELAKQEPSRVLASATIVTRAPPGEMAHWFLGEEKVLRGRPAATRLATPTANGAREGVSGC